MKDVDPTIANQALKLALEWGEHFHKPIQPRLALLQPALTAEQLDAYNALAVEARDAGLKFVYDAAEKHSLNSGRPATFMREQMLKRYPWVDDANLGAINSQGSYYAWHDGVGG